MERVIDLDLKKLKDLVSEMGSNVEQAIDSATLALLKRETQHIENVSKLEKLINASHIQVDEECLKILARQSPLARDLRLIVAIIKINTDLERMGDQAVNISHNAARYLAGPAVKPLVDIPKMSSAVKTMVRNALDALVKQDIDLAKDVLYHDDEVDQLKAKVFNDLVAFMETNPHMVQQGITLILIARNLERLGDHATNIAEDVIFFATGEDIRHGSGSQRTAGQT